jgi:hypothetical protein
VQYNGGMSAKPKVVAAAKPTIAPAARFEALLHVYPLFQQSDKAVQHNLVPA